MFQTISFVDLYTCSLKTNYGIINFKNALGSLNKGSYIKWKQRLYFIDT